MLTQLYDEIYDMLVPLSSYIQPHPAWTTSSIIRDGRPHGFPSELAIAIIPAVIIGLFFEGFFRELGKEAANKFIKNINERFFKSGELAIESELDDLEVMIVITRSELIKIPKQTIENVEMQGERKISECLQEVGLPAQKAEKLASEIVQILDRRVQDLIASQEITRKDI